MNTHETMGGSTSAESFKHTSVKDMIADKDYNPVSPNERSRKLFKELQDRAGSDRPDALEAKVAIEDIT